MKAVVPPRSKENRPSIVADSHAARPSTPPVIERRLVGRFGQQQPDPERHHQARQVGAAHDQKLTA